MKNQSENYLDFEIDKLTNSIENVISGEVFDTIISIVGKSERNQINKSEWILIGPQNSE
jgi:hypothetical protein